ncbi:MAG: hypothetical protein HND56_05960 [Pseudomonadota bacterium]|nr:MAG: hypothetical protein HND56_05960 [Pseudomonadota bacterium]
MRILYVISISLLLIFFPTPSKATNPVYTHVGKGHLGYGAVRMDDDIIVFGRLHYYVFNTKVPWEAPLIYDLPFEFYVHSIAKAPNGDLLLAGHNHKRRFDPSSLLGLPDKRQNILVRAKLEDRKLKIIRSRKLQDRLSYGLGINSEGQPVLLSGGNGIYRLTVFTDTTINKTEQSLEIHSGDHSSPAFAITPQGHYAILGFERVTKEKHSSHPTYWEYDSTLSLITKNTLSTEKKSTGNGLSQTALLVYKNNVYAVYGWDKTNDRRRQEMTEDIHILKLQGTPIWAKAQTLPYSTRMPFFLLQKGDPYAIRNLQRITFSAKDGKTTTEEMTQQTVPQDCFPPGYQGFRIVDILPNTDGTDYIVVNGNADVPQKYGCVTIGRLK